MISWKATFNSIISILVTGGCQYKKNLNLKIINLKSFLNSLIAAWCFDTNLFCKQNILISVPLYMFDSRDNVSLSPNTKPWDFWEILWCGLSPIEKALWYPDIFFMVREVLWWPGAFSWTGKLYDDRTLFIVRGVLWWTDTFSSFKGFHDDRATFHRLRSFMMTGHFFIVREVLWWLGAFFIVREVL